MNQDEYLEYIESELKAAKAAAKKAVNKTQKTWAERNQTYPASPIEPFVDAEDDSYEILRAEHEDKPVAAMDTQEGGDHYKKCKIQPLEYALENGLGVCEHAVVKYITRYQDKNGVEDLKKAKHYIDILIERISK